MAAVERAAEAQPEVTLAAEPEVEAPVAEIAPEPEFEAAPETEFEVAAVTEEAPLGPEPAVEEIVVEPEPESTVEVEPAPVAEVVAESLHAEEEPESEPAQEPDVPTTDAAVEVEPVAELKAVEAAAPVEHEPEQEVAAAAEDIQEPAETVETTPEITIAVAEPELEPASQVDAPQESAVPSAITFEASMQKPPVEPAIQDDFEQVTELPVTVENVNIDEVTPQAESAISYDLVPVPASPVPDEITEPATQAAIELKEESVEQVTSNVVEPDAEEIVAQTTEATEVEFVDQAVEQPMISNQPNSEPDAELEDPSTTASPLHAAEQPVHVPDGPVEVPSVPDEPASPTIVAAAAHHPSKPFIRLEAKQGDVNASPFSVIVSEVYDGPLDLLLDLIRKQDIDIYDIPIARITAQFLAYVNQLKESDVDVAGEFIYTASLLIHIKSKLLLPRAPSGQDDATEDPRRELVERLLEHERFKNAAQMLQQKQMLEAATWTNPGVREFKEDASAEPEIAADTVDLVRVFREILERARNRPVLNVDEDSVTVGQMIQFLSRRLSMEDHPIALRKLLSHSRSERALIAMFLALLELVRLQAILLRQDLAFSEIFIKKHSNFDSVINESTAQDDWK